LAKPAGVRAEVLRPGQDVGGLSGDSSGGFTARAAGWLVESGLGESFGAAGLPPLPYGALPLGHFLFAKVVIDYNYLPQQECRAAAGPGHRGGAQAAWGGET